MSPTAFLLIATAALAVAASTRQASSHRKSRSQCNCACGNGRESRIVGGKAADEHEFPWIATMAYNGTFYCGASLITQRHLLTAAHCLYGKNARFITIGLGDHDRSRDEPGELQSLRIRRATIHSGFSLAKIQHDIGMVELVNPVQIKPPLVRTACLPHESSGCQGGMEGVVAGWGREHESGKVSNILRKVDLPLIDYQECGTKFGYSSKKIHSTNICAGYQHGAKDACQGDSGGPLHIVVKQPREHMQLCGVTSWGRGCARPNYPGVYTDVAQYIPWIRKQVGDECLCHSPQLSN